MVQVVWSPMRKSQIGFTVPLEATGNIMYMWMRISSPSRAKNFSSLL